MAIYTDDDLSIRKRVSYDQVANVCDALFEAFHPNGLEDKEDLDERFHSHWILFLHTVGWTEAEYWEERDKRADKETCPDCGVPLEEGDEDDLASDPLNLTDTEKKTNNGLN